MFTQRVLVFGIVRAIGVVLVAIMMMSLVELCALVGVVQKYSSAMLDIVISEDVSEASQRMVRPPFS